MRSYLERFVNVPPGGLITWMASQCVMLPVFYPLPLETYVAWCESHMGEARPGNVWAEVQEGHLDYFDGDWQMFFDPYCHHEQLVIWFARSSDRAQFILTFA